MNSQLPPIDSDLREGLARRSAGRLPDGLLADISAALDGVREPRARTRWPRLIWSVPRLAVAGVGVALVAILAVAIAFPAFHPGPAASLAGYPTDRALTTAELARLMAGPQLPTNTTLVASVTIDARTDVCPMNRYPTVGVIHGIDPQVCVMGATLAAELAGPTVTGTFAFRYLAPGYLGLLGGITPASSSKIAFRVAEDWPLAGKTFLVEGYLGAVGLPLSIPSDCATPPTAGDVLDPNGEDCPYDDWLGDDPTAAAIQSDHVYIAGSPEPSYDPLSLRGNARHVEAGGMRLIDSIDQAAPVHGVYVVRGVTGPCPGASPVDSRGCGTWRVLAKVADVALPEPSSRTAPPNPTPTPSPTATGTATSVAGYPTDRALTTAELARLMAGPPLPTNTTLVASTTIDIRTDVCPMNSRPTVGVIQGVDPQVCVMGATLSAQLPGSTAQGVLAFRYLAPGYLGLLGEITPASSSNVAFKVADGWPLAGKTFLVEGWLGAYPISCPTYIATSGGDPLDPDGQDQCAFNWLTDDPNAERSTSPNGLLPPGGGRFVEAGGMRLIDAIPSDAPIHGVYVVRNMGQSWRVLAKVADVALPEPSARTAPPNPTPTPTTAPPATPVAEPSGPLAPAQLGLLGSGNRPLTEGEFATLWAADPAHLAGRIAIVKGPVPTGFECWDAGAADAAVPSPACHIIAILDGQIAAEGYWAVRVGADGKLTIVGEISVPQDSYVFTLDQAVAAWNKAGGQAQFFVVDAWINGMGADSCDVVGQACYEVSWLGSTPGNQLLNVQLGAYHEFGAGPVGGGPAIHALFLIEIPNGKTCGLGPQQSAGACADHGEILAHLEAVPAP